jgi:putative oxidoreductase
MALLHGRNLTPKQLPLVTFLSIAYRLFFMKSFFYSKLIKFASLLQSPFLLALRLLWGYQFFKSGYNKFHDIASIAGFFQELQIPFPLANAYLVSTVELVGGALLILGFATRLAALPLIISMTVAILTAEKESAMLFFTDPTILFGRSPFTFLMASLTLFLFGPGFFSLDRLFKWENKIIE